MDRVIRTGIRPPDGSRRVTPVRHGLDIEQGQLDRLTGRDRHAGRGQIHRRNSPVLKTPKQLKLKLTTLANPIPWADTTLSLSHDDTPVQIAVCG